MRCNSIWFGPGSKFLKQVPEVSNFERDGAPPDRASSSTERYTHRSSGTHRRHDGPFDPYPAGRLGAPMSTDAMPEWGASGSEIVQLASDAARAFFDALSLIARLVLAILRPTLRYLGPKANRFARRSWTSFWSQPARAIALQAAGALVFGALLLLERRFGFFRGLLRFARRARRATSDRYRAVQAALGRQSRSAAALFPHMLFVGAAGVAEHFVVKGLSGGVRGGMLVVVGVVAPVVRTVRLLYAIDTSSLDSDVDTPIGRGGDSSRAGHSSRAGDASRAGDSSRSSGRPEGLSSLRRRASNVASAIEHDGVESPAVGEGSPLTPPRSPSPRPLKRVQTLPATGLSRSSRPRTAFTEADERAARRAKEAELLELWVCAALVGAGRSVLRFFCPALLLPMVARLDDALLYLFVWLQASWTKGCRPMFAVISAFLGLRAVFSPRASARKAETSDTASKRVGFALRMAVALNLLTQPRADELADCFAESGVALAGVLFFFTPGFLTFCGTIVVALLAPAYFSAGTLAIASGAAATRRNWLTYFSVFAVVETVWEVAGGYFAWFPLWWHLKMAVVLWLQLPYYRGAATVLHYGMHGATGAMNKVSKSRYTPRKFHVQ